MFNKFILCAAVGLCLTGTVNAQEACGTDVHHKLMLQQYPGLASFEEQLEAEVNHRLERTTATSPTDTSVLDIAVVVHVVHDYGIEWLTDNAIYTAVDNWTKVFMCQNTADTASVIAPFKKWIGNPRMRLHLATKDPNGNPTKGVVRHQSYWTAKAGDQAKFESWDQTRYINIWFINAFGGSMTGTAAYAQYPSSAAFSPQYDGVISLYNYMDYANTINHEIGHCMNLQHVWGNNNNAAVACGNDQVDDTPPTKGHNPGGCAAAAIYDTACAANYSKTYVRPSTGFNDSVVNYPDTVNAQNVMDYTYCSKMFTLGQVARMRGTASLGGTTAGRSTLYTPATIASTGSMAPFPDLPPVAEYCVNKASGTAFVSDVRTFFLTVNNAALFSFKNYSWNDTITGVQWTFSNGASTPTSTSISSVTTSFSQPGWVTVTLKATANSGTTTLTNTHAVFAADTVPVARGVVENFTSAAVMDKWPAFNTYNNRFLWEYYSGTGYDDGGCVRFLSFDASNKFTGDPVGDRDDFHTPAYDLEGIGKAYINYYTAGANISTGSRYDSMIIEASITGGQRWTKIASHYGSDLANNGGKSGSFVPTTASQWKPRADSIPMAFRNKNTFFRFRYFAGNKGNNLYLDKVSVDQWPVDVKEAMEASASLFSVFPNPANNGFNLVFNSGKEGIVSYTVRDITGKLVYQHSATFAPNTTQQENIARSVTPAAGMYLITVTIDGVNKTEKLVVY